MCGAVYVFVPSHYVQFHWTGKSAPHLRRCDVSLLTYKLCRVPSIYGTFEKTALKIGRHFSDHSAERARPVSFLWVKIDIIWCL